MAHNESVKLGFLFGWGIVIYAVMYLAWSGLVLYGVSGGILARLFMLTLLVMVMTLAGRSLMRERWEDILPYSLSWLCIVFFFDIFFAVRTSGLEIFTDPNIWLTYALIVFVPIISPRSRLTPS